MSGHSKWATTKRRKAAVDAKRSSLFTKLTNTISVAAREGGDPDSNFKLRMAIDKARSFSVPKENIERAIKRGTGELGGEQIEEITYEGYGPSGVAVIVECLTDNKNRTSSNLKHLFNQYDGSLAASGSVAWQFERKGLIILANNNLDEAKQLKIIEAGAEDLEEQEGQTWIYTKATELEKVKNNLNNFTVIEASLTWVAKDKIKVENPDKLNNFFEKLDDLDEVNNIYSNAQLT